jgi:hypothetical protein
MKALDLAAVLSTALLLATAGQAADGVDPDSIDVVDALECRLDAPAYTGFAMALNGEEKIADKRHWVRIKTKNPFINEYELPTAIKVAGHYSTRRIAFTSSGVLAILDLDDPTALAREQKIENAVNPDPLIDAMIASGKATPQEIQAATKSGKFLGEKIVVDRTERPSADEMFGAHIIIARNVSNVTTHPGKTLYGCSYRMEMIDKDGKPV